MKLRDYSNKLYGLTKTLFNNVIPLDRILNVSVEGEESLPRETGYILAANHGTLLDPLYVGIGIKDEEFIFPSTKWVYEIPLGIITRSYNTKLITKGKTLKNIPKNLRNGHAYLIFPEGGTPRRGTKRKTGKGIMHNCLKMKSKGMDCPVYPTGITGNVVWYVGLPLFYKGGVRIKIGPPLEIPAEKIDNYKSMKERSNRAGMKEIEWELTRNLMERIHELAEYNQVSL
jgi:1-acyl-sn-glycerol-3-phosphate acyltransferase